MTKSLTVLGFTTTVGKVRKRQCSRTGCTNKTKMALIVPVSDIGEDGGPGLAAFAVCSDHIEEDIVLLAKGF